MKCQHPCNTIPYGATHVESVLWCLVIALFLAFLTLQKCLKKSAYSICIEQTAGLSYQTAYIVYQLTSVSLLFHEYPDSKVLSVGCIVSGNDANFIQSCTSYYPGDQQDVKSRGVQKDEDTTRAEAIRKGIAKKREFSCCRGTACSFIVCRRAVRALLSLPSCSVFAPRRRFRLVAFDLHRSL